MIFADASLHPDDIVLGMDEAGRGPVLGPMVIAHVRIPASQLHAFADLGARDSKECTDSMRRDLFKKIKAVCEWGIYLIYPEQIDSYELGLNILEMSYVIQAAKSYTPNHLIIDSPYSPEAHFNLQTHLFEHGVDVKHMHCYAENKADSLYPIVSAASIIAKETRERAMEKLREQYQVDFGSGYPADPKTKKFIAENWKDEKYSPLIRKSWATYKRLAK